MPQDFIGEVTDVEVVQTEFQKALCSPLRLRDQREREIDEGPGLQTEFRQWRHSQEPIRALKV